VGSVHDTPQVHVEQAVHILERLVAKLSDQRDTGVVEHVVEASVLPNRALDQRSDRGGVGHVEIDGFGPPPGPANLLDGRGREARLHVGEVDDRPAPRERFREGATDPRRSAGDDRNAVLERFSSHGLQTPSSRSARFAAAATHCPAANVGV
jgi:hypothetical protein